MMISKDDLEKMQWAAKVPGLSYWTTVDSAPSGDAGLRVVVNFFGFESDDHAVWFSRYISFLLSLNNMEYYPDVVH